MPKRIVIVGGGIAGLAAGCYARMNGYEAEVFEAHKLPGGLCTSWQRGGFTIDGCLHWLVGSAPGSDFHTFWRELGVFPGTAMVDHEDFGRFVARSGRTFTLYTDADRLESHLQELSPVDAPLARELCRSIRLFSTFNPPVGGAFETMGFLDILRLVARMRRFMKPLNALAGVTIGEWAARWNDPLLRDAWVQPLQNDRYSLQALVLTLADLHRRTAGFPVGGSLALARRVADRFASLGGSIRYGARVQRILAEGGRACGLQLADGETVRADVVVSAADLRQTVEELLGGRFREPQHEELFRDVPVLPPGLLVSVGLKDSLPEQPGAVARELPAPIGLGGVQTRWLPVRNMGFDSTLLPPDTTLLEMLFEARYDWWARLQDERSAYKKEKERVLHAVLRELERFYPELQQRLVMTDVATPLTFARYTSSWHGTYMTWIHNAETQQRFRVIKKTLPGLKDFYLCGMWLMAPGGVPAAVKSARDVVQMLCQADGSKFTTRLA